MTQTPRRWSGSELPEELNAALSSADADSSEQAIERLRARLSDALGPSFGDAAQPTAAAQAQPAARALHLLTPGKWLGIGALFAIGFGVFLIRGPAAPAGHAEGVTHGALPEAAQPAPAVDAPKPQDDPLSQAAAPNVESRAIAIEPVPQDTIAHAEQPMAAASAKAARTNKRSMPQPQKPVELGLAEELRQLEQIRQLLRVSPARALVEADTHARRFSHGTLGPERELLRVDALLRLGRNAEARKLADQMLAAKEGHPYRAQIEKLLAAP